MNDRRYQPTRRELLKTTLLAGTAMAAGPAFVHGQPVAGLITKPIPSSGEQVPLIGIGTARRYDVPLEEEQLAPLREVLARMPDVGCSMIDTAPSYGNAETVVGKLLNELGNRDRMFLCTKVRTDDAESARAEIEQSFELLGVDMIDLLQVHNLAGIDEVLPMLRDLKAEGRIRYYGITTSFPRQYEEFEQVLAREEMDFIQIDYAIDNRGADERIIPLAGDRGVAVQINSPFGRGRVFEAFGNQPIPDWAAEYGISTWAQFALKYIVSHPDVTCAIPGTAKLEYLEDNIRASHGPLPDAATRERMAALIESA